MIEELAARLREGETTARDLAEKSLARIAERADGNAFLTVTAERALCAAEKADRRIAAGEKSLLCGIPAAIKDNFTVQGVRTTAASRVLADFVPPYSATAWENLEAAGAELLGKTNMDEFAMGAAGVDSAFGAVKNPLAPDFVAGGSSSGSAAAVADGQAVFALGSDTGGSVRVPAAFCGVVGLKPTYGMISRRGLIAFASSLDTVGILTKTVRDAAIVLDATAAPDLCDMTSIARTDTLSAWLTAIDGGVRGMRIGVVKDRPGLSPETSAAYERSAAALAAQGAHIREITLPSAEDCYTAYYLIAASEASSNLARYDGVRYGTAADGASIAEEMCRARAAFGHEVKRRLLSGAYALSRDGRAEYYERALSLRAEITALMTAQFSLCDVILTPTVPAPACRTDDLSADALPYRDIDSLCTVASLSGMPAISVPVRADGLPIGMQLIAPRMGERVLFAAAAALEAAYE